MSAYQDLLKLNPNHEEALFSLGWVFIDEKRLMEATPLFKKLIALKPN
ncbi:tetratricopeptide repeat protein, partial [Hyphomonas atlantica]